MKGLQLVQDDRGEALADTRPETPSTSLLVLGERHLYLCLNRVDADEQLAPGQSDHYLPNLNKLYFPRTWRGFYKHSYSNVVGEGGNAVAVRMCVCGV